MKKLDLLKSLLKKDIMNPVADLLNIVANVKKKMMIEIINLNIIRYNLPKIDIICQFFYG